MVSVLCAEPVLLPSAVEELLRYNAPVQSTRRDAREEVHIGNKHIQAGQAIIEWLGAANHGPDHFSHPDQLDVRRRSVQRHLAFVHGSHFCLGARLPMGCVTRFDS
jgi:pimeloyl-[acyl-carrier protein] synthase